MSVFHRQNKFSLITKTLTLTTLLTDPLVCYHYSCVNPFFSYKTQDFFVPLLPVTPFVGASDIDQDLLTRGSFLSVHLEPPKVFFTLYNTKEVHKVIRYNFSENNIQDTVRYPPVPQKEISNISPIPRKLLNGQFLQSRTEKEQSCNCSQDISKNHQEYISFFVHDLSCKSCILFRQ